MCLLELCGLLQQFIREITVANAGYVQLLHKIFLMAVETFQYQASAGALSNSHTILFWKAQWNWLKFVKIVKGITVNCGFHG